MTFELLILLGLVLIAIKAVFATAAMVMKHALPIGVFLIVMGYFAYETGIGKTINIQNPPTSTVSEQLYQQRLKDAADAKIKEYNDKARQRVYDAAHKNLDEPRKSLLRQAAEDQKNK